MSSLPATTTAVPFATVLLSGGLDSTVLAYHMQALGYGLHLLSINYGQRHSRELDSAVRVAEVLARDVVPGRVEHQVIDLSVLSQILPGNALTDRSVEVPEGHYESQTMRSTIVPNRNAIFLSVATGFAVAHGDSVLATAVHAGDHAIYPDCRPDFIAAFGAMVRLSVEGLVLPHFQVIAPFVFWSKSSIVAYGNEHNVPFEVTWSCYKGGAKHCGVCGTCQERREAFQLAGIEDPTEYEEG